MSLEPDGRCPGRAGEIVVGVAPTAGGPGVPWRSAQGVGRVPRGATSSRRCDAASLPLACRVAGGRRWGAGRWVRGCRAGPIPCRGTAQRSSGHRRGAATSRWPRKPAPARSSCSGWS